MLPGSQFNKNRLSWAESASIWLSNGAWRKRRQVPPQLDIGVSCSSCMIAVSLPAVLPAREQTLFRDVERSRQDRDNNLRDRHRRY